MKVEYFEDSLGQNLYIKTHEGVIAVGCSHKTAEQIMKLQKKIVDEGGRVCVTRGRRVNSTVLNKCKKIGEFEYTRGETHAI